MTNEEFQKIVLSNFEFMNKHFAQIDQRFAQIDNRLEQHEQMISELMRIVGNTNAMVEEIRQEMTETKAELKQDIANVKTELKQEIADVKDDLKNLRRHQAEEAKVVDVLAVNFLKHEADIKELRRAL